MSGQGVSVLSDSTVHILNNLMREEIEVAIITFNSGASLHTPWTNVNGTVTPFTAGGGTNFGSAINEVLSFLGSHDAGSQRAGVALFCLMVMETKPATIMFALFQTSALPCIQSVSQVANQCILKIWLN